MGVRTQSRLRAQRIATALCFTRRVPYMVRQMGVRTPSRLRAQRMATAGSKLCQADGRPDPKTSTGAVAGNDIVLFDSGSKPISFDGHPDPKLSSQCAALFFTMRVPSMQRGSSSAEEGTVVPQPNTCTKSVQRQAVGGTSCGKPLVSPPAMCSQSISSHLMDIASRSASSLFDEAKKK